MNRPIAVFIPELHDRGGTERATLECVRRWSRTRTITIYTERVLCELPEDVTVHRVQIPPGPHLFRWVIFYLWATLVSRRLRSAPTPAIIFSPGVNLYRADVTVSHINFTAYRAAIRSMPLREPVTTRWTLPNLHRAVYRRLLSAVEPGFYRRARFVFAVSPSEVAALSAIGRRNVGLAPNGVDRSQFALHPPLSDRTHLRLLAVGTDTWKKGLDTAIEALASPQITGRVSLSIVTRIANSTELSGLCEFFGVGRAVEFVYDDIDASNLFTHYDALIAPSRDDSFNMPVLEALASGMPVVLSNKCGVSHWVSDAAFVIGPSSAIQLADAIARILREPDLVDAKRLRGLHVAEQMTWDVPASAVATAFDELDRSPSRTRRWRRS